MSSKRTQQRHARAERLAEADDDETDTQRASRLAHERKMQQLENSHLLAREYAMPDHRYPVPYHHSLDHAWWHHAASEHEVRHGSAMAMSSG